MVASELVVDQWGPAPQVWPEHLGAIDTYGQARVETHHQVLFHPGGTALGVRRHDIAAALTIRLPVPANMM
jgi:hypothetical protein